MAVHLINHKDQQIIFIDYTSCHSIDELIKCINDSVDIVKSMDNNLLVMSDVTGIRVDGQFMEELKKAGAEFEYKVKKSAVIGVTGLKKVFLSGYNLVVKNKVRAFDSKEEALDYLVS